MSAHEPFAVCTTAIIVVTCIYSVIGFRDPAFRERHLFSVQEIFGGKEFFRLFTCALLHADWNHLLLNMVTLYLFGTGIELSLGIRHFLVIYLVAILGGSAVSLWIHRHHEYRAYGASGGVCGLVFSYIFLFPGGSIFLFPLPMPIPAWLYAILFLVGSFVALKRQIGNIGHDAHLGGAIIGLWTTSALSPEIVRWQPRLFMAISALSVLLFVYLVKNPLFLPISSFIATRRKGTTKSARPTRARDESIEVDAILEKVSRTGPESLSKKERSLLDSVAAKCRKKDSPGRGEG